MASSHVDVVVAHLDLQVYRSVLSVDQGPILLAICRSLVVSLHCVELTQLSVILSNRVFDTGPASSLACLDVGCSRLGSNNRSSLLCS